MVTFVFLSGYLCLMAKLLLFSFAKAKELILLRIYQRGYLFMLNFDMVTFLFSSDYLSLKVNFFFAKA